MWKRCINTNAGQIAELEKEHNLDELDVRIFRQLITSGTIAPSHFQVKTSLREIARRLGVDDMTAWNRFKRFQEVGLLSGWKLAMNPRLFGYGMKEIFVDVEPESAKQDVIRKLKLVHGVVVVANSYGSSMMVQVLYESAEELSRTVELISRITHTERIVSFNVPFPQSETKHLTNTDWAIVHALQNDARKSYLAVAKELGFSSRTVKNRIAKLEREMTVMALPDLNVGAVEGVIPAQLLYSYTKEEMKSAVDQAMLSHFDGRYLWGRLTEPDHAYLVLAAPTMIELKRYLDWARQQPGVANAETGICTECIILYDKFAEVFSRPLATPLAVN